MEKYLNWYFIVNNKNEIIHIANNWIWEKVRILSLRPCLGSELFNWIFSRINYILGVTPTIQ